MTQAPITDKVYVLQKFKGKGGWTYAELPEIPPRKNNPFGWVQVRGFIDDYEIKNYKLMPMGNGHLFLPVKYKIRQTIGKKEGDTVHITLFEDHSTYEVPAEIIECIEFEPSEIKTAFENMPDGMKKEIIEWIYEAKHDDTKAKRIARLIDILHERAFK